MYVFGNRTDMARHEAVTVNEMFSVIVRVFSL